MSKTLFFEMRAEEMAREEQFPISKKSINIVVAKGKIFVYTHENFSLKLFLQTGSEAGKPIGIVFQSQNADYIHQIKNIKDGADVEITGRLKGLEGFSSGSNYMKNEIIIKKIMLL